MSLQRLMWVVLAVLVLSAYSNRFVQDDAFISFRYASNLLNHAELTWNVGEERPIEGYSNFLWVLMIAGAMGMGMEPVWASQALGLMFALVTLLYTYRLSKLVFGEERPALLTMVLLGTNYTFSVYATGGLATQMQTCLIVTGTYVAVGMHLGVGWGRGGAWMLSALAGLALLTRLDSGLPFVLLMCFVLWSRWSKGEPTIPLVVGLVVPVGVLVLPWLGWKLYYYQDIVPNTYYAKAGQFNTEILLRGLRYLYEFLVSYFLLPFVLIGVVVFRRLRPRGVMGWLGVVVLGWCVYVVKIGGGFMEFRMLVPILPLLFILIVALILCLEDKPARIAFLALVIIGSAHHMIGYRTVDQIARVEHLHAAANRWANMGRSMKTHFHGASPPVKIATTAAGAIPDFSELPTVDMHGLNDRFIAKHGEDWLTIPGHWRITSHRYLIEQGVHLVIGHPLRRKQTDQDLPEVLGQGIRGFRILAVEPELTPGPVAVIDLPFDEENKVLILYLKPHPYIDTVIREAGFNVRYISTVEM